MPDGASVEPIEDEGLEFEGEDTGGEDLGLPQSGRTVHALPSDPDIGSLYDRHLTGKLVLQPDFQRQYVWDQTKASRLIESVLLKVPLPTVYLAEEVEGKTAVIDGQQRLTALFSYLGGKHPNGKAFKLFGLSVLSELNGKVFADLGDEHQGLLKQNPIRVVTILKESPPDLKFEIFERLNTGAIPLNDMELRNCVYRGEYMHLLKDLADEPDFRELLALKEPDKRMRDLELILRFAAFYYSSYLKYQPPIRRFLNHDMQKHQHLSTAEADDLRRAFKNGLAISKSLFGENAFKRFYRGSADDHNGYWEPKKLNTSLYDVIMAVFCGVDKPSAYACLDALREAIMDLMVNNDEFVDSISLGTSSIERVKKRFDLMRGRVEPILGEHPPEERCFSAKLKQQFFESDPTCEICGNMIQTVDDSAVDHIEQYWRGGKTIPDNARLVHRYCNWARPKTA